MMSSGHTLTTADKRALATLIYYPEEKIEYVRKTEEDMDNWYKIMLYRLIEVCKKVCFQISPVKG